MIELTYLHTVKFNDPDGYEQWMEIYHDPGTNCCVGLDASALENLDNIFDPYNPGRRLHVSEDDFDSTVNVTDLTQSNGPGQEVPSNP